MWHHGFTGDTVFFGHSPLLWRGVLREPQTGFCPIIDLHSLCCLRQPFHRRPKEDGCSSVPFTTPPSSLTWVLTRWLLHIPLLSQRKEPLKNIITEAMIVSAFARGRSNLKLGELFEASYRRYTSSFLLHYQPDKNPTHSNKDVIFFVSRFVLSFFTGVSLSHFWKAFPFKSSVKTVDI